MPVIKQIYAYIIADKDAEDEGIPGFQLPDGTMMPLVGADLGRIKELKDVAQSMANQLEKSIKIVKFTVREEVEVIEPVMGPVTQHKKMKCPSCDYGLDASTGFRTSQAPSEGDVTICINCEGILRYGKDLELTLVPEEALKELEQDERQLLQEASRAIREVKAQNGDHHLGRKSSTH